MIKMPSKRLTYFLGFIVIACLISSTFYLEKYAGFVPCPLCILQRLMLGLTGVAFFFGSLTSTRFWGWFATLSLCLGTFLAGRQVWLQHLPLNPNADCGVSLQFLLKVLPFDQALSRILQGSAECAQKGWEFLHLSLAEWSLGCFILLLLLSLFQLHRTRS